MIRKEWSRYGCFFLRPSGYRLVRNERAAGAKSVGTNMPRLGAKSWTMQNRLPLNLKFYFISFFGAEKFFNAKSLLCLSSETDFVFVSAGGGGCLALEITCWRLALAFLLTLEVSFAALEDTVEAHFVALVHFDTSMIQKGFNGTSQTPGPHKLTSQASSAKSSSQNLAIEPKMMKTTRKHSLITTRNELIEFIKWSNLGNRVNIKIIQRGAIHLVRWDWWLSVCVLSDSHDVTWIPNYIFRCFHSAPPPQSPSLAEMFCFAK